MLYLLPFLTWIAAITSGVLLFVLWDVEALRGYKSLAHVAWFAGAGYCQFFGGTTVVSTVGMAAQTALAVVLMIRWKISR